MEKKRSSRSIKKELELGNTKEEKDIIKEIKEKEEKNSNKKKPKKTKKVTEKKEESKKKVTNKKEKKVSKEEQEEVNEIVNEIIEDIKESKKKHSKLKIVLIMFVVLLCLLIVASVVYKLLLPKIELIGKEEIIVNYNKDYKEKGCKASYNGKDLTKYIKVKGKVNTKKMGVYTITCEVKYNHMTNRVQRKVVVKDIEKPTIKVNVDGDIYACPGSTYKVPEYTATDNYDKDLTKKVVIDNKNDSVTFSVTDKSGNTKKVIKKVIYKDIEKPKLELIGDKTRTIYVNDEYKEEGYTVSDNCDTDVSNKVGVEGFVNTKEAGEYRLKYTVEDKYGNKAEEIRTIYVMNKGGKGAIYLTFDDGPLEGNTAEILDILKEEGVKATFFVTSHGPDELIKRETEEGHEVALHTATHNYAYLYSSVENYYNDLYQVRDRVKRITGKDAKLIRFPGGASNTVSRKYAPGIMSTLTQDVEARGFKYCDRNISSGDAGNTTDPNVVYSNVVNGLSHDKANVVLMHDIKVYTKNALRNIIRYGKEHGYYFAKLDYYSEMIHQRVNN